jgi:hypothetical protein
VTAAASPDDASLHAFRRFRDHLKRTVPWFDAQERATPAGTPFLLTVEMPGGGQISLSFVPDQQLQRPFEEFLTAAVTGECGLDPAARALVCSFPPSLSLVLWVARWCGSSAKAFSSLARFALEAPGLKLRVADVESVPAREIPAGIESVPVLFVGGSGRFYGDSPELELARGIVDLASERSERFMVGHMLDRRLRVELLALMKAGAVSPRSLAAEVGSESFSRRAAAVVSLSDLALSDRLLAAEALPVLEGLLGGSSAQVRGDAVFALAEVGDLRAIPAVEKLCSDPDPDVREGAEEALEKIKKRAVWGWGA